MSISTKCLKEVEDFKKYEDLQIALKQAFGLLMEFYILKETPEDDFANISELLKDGLTIGFMSFEDTQKWLLRAQTVLKHMIQTFLIQDEELKSGVKITQDQLKQSKPFIKAYLDKKKKNLQQHLPGLVSEIESSILEEAQPLQTNHQTQTANGQGKLNKSNARVNPREGSKGLGVPPERGN